MTVEEDVLARVVQLLEDLNIPYMVTGSIASSYHGRPRATHYADVVIDPTPQQLESLVSALQAAGFYADAAGAREALAARHQFNAIEMARATKIDLIVRRARPFSLEEFGRRQRVDFAFRRGVATVTAEDAVLSKLEWARPSGDSERQIRDAAGIVDVTPHLDAGYISRWAEQLGVLDLWERIAPRA